MSSAQEIIINYKNENLMLELKEKGKPELKQITSKLNTKKLFHKNQEERSKTINNSKNNYDKTISKNSEIKNHKQIFKRIKLKIVGNLISKDLMKINPYINTEPNNTIKAIKANIKYKEKTFIPNKIDNKNINRKNLNTISEPENNIKNNDKIDKNRNQSQKNNPFNMINQPIDPMTIEMKKYKKMKMRENKIILEKKSVQKRIPNSYKKIKKTKTNINFDNIKKEITTIEKNNESNFNEKKMFYISFKENKNINRKKTNDDGLQKLKTTNSNSDSNNQLSFENNKIINYNRYGISHINNDFIYRSSQDNIKNSIPNQKEDKSLQKTLISINTKNSLNSITNIPLKNNIIKRKIGNKRKNSKIDNLSSYDKPNSKNIDSKKIRQQLKLSEFDNILNRKQTDKSSSRVHSKKNAKKIQDKKKYSNKIINKYNKNEINENKNIINEKIEKFFDILINLKKYNLYYFWNQLKKIIIIQNIKKSKEIDKTEFINLKISKKNKNDNINKALDIINIFYMNKIFLLKKQTLTTLKSFWNHIKKNIVAKKLVKIFSEYKKSKQIKTYLKIKKFLMKNKKIEATKKIYYILTKNIFCEKNNTLYKLKEDFKRRKKIVGIESICNILSKKYKIKKKFFFQKFILYYNIHQKKENIKKIKDIIIKFRKLQIKEIIFIFEIITKYKERLKSLENLSKLISNKIIYDKRFSFNKIKKFISSNKKLEGINRFKDIFVEMKINKNRIFFIEFINKIKILKINSALKKIGKIILLKEIKIKNVIFKEFKSFYKKQINIIKLVLVLESIITRITKENKKYSFKYIYDFIRRKNNNKNKVEKTSINKKKSFDKLKINKKSAEKINLFNLEKKNTEKRWENNKIDSNIFNIQINSRKKIPCMSKNILREDSISFSLSKKEKENNKIINGDDNEDNSDNEIWTINIEKWGVICNLDDSLYQKVKED